MGVKLLASNYIKCLRYCQGLLGHANYSVDKRRKRTKRVIISQLKKVSLRKHNVEIAKLLHDYQIDIRDLNEPSLSKDVCDNEVSIEGYNIYRQDRDSCFYKRYPCP